jgi:sporulation protein YlmC with PRC-barrel domain
MNETLLLTLITAGALGIFGSTHAQVAMGWSAKKGILGKTVYNDAGARIGKVEDLIISPDKNLSFLVVGAGGFVGIGRHDVAIPINQVRQQDGKIILTGATKESLKAMAPFDYANDSAKRDEFIAKADQDIHKARAKLAEAQKKAGEATAEARTRMDAQIATLQADLKTAEAKLGDLRRASAKGWKQFENDVSAAMARLRKSAEAAVG